MATISFDIPPPTSGIQWLMSLVPWYCPKDSFVIFIFIFVSYLDSFYFYVFGFTTQCLMLFIPSSRFFIVNIVFVISRRDYCLRTVLHIPVPSLSCSWFATLLIIWNILITCILMSLHTKSIIWVTLGFLSVD